MNKKSKFVLVSSLILVVTLYYVPTMLAQEMIWDRAIVSAYGELVFQQDPPVGAFTFNVATPPAGSEATNTIILTNYDPAENHTNNLAPGNVVAVTYMDFEVNEMNFVPASETNYYTFFYDGPASSVTVNDSQIPEFSTILLVPLFITVTLLAIIYRRKRTQK